MSIVSCPKCTDAVTLPAAASPRATVRCPLCQEEFPLSELLDTLPPALIVVEDPEEGKEQIPSEAGFVMESAPAAAIGVQEEGDNDSSAGGFAIETTAAAPASTTKPAAGKRRRSSGRPERKKKSPAMEVLKIVLGGVAGLVIAQLILWWLPAKWRRDPFKLGPTVSQYAPWMVPAQFHNQNAARPGVENGAGQAAPDSHSSAQPSRAQSVNTSQGAASGTGSEGPFAIGAGGAAVGDDTGMPKRTFIDPNQNVNDAAQATSGDAPAEKSPPRPRTEPASKTSATTPAAADPTDADRFAPVAGKDDSDASGVAVGPLTDLDLDADLLDMMDASGDGTDQQTGVQPPAGDPTDAALDERASTNRIAGAPRITAAELRVVLDEASTATQTWSAADDPTNQQLVVQCYQTLAKLAEAVTFADKLDFGERQAVSDLLQQVAADPQRRAILRKIGSRWPKYSGREGVGVLLVGTVLAAEQEGDLNATRLEVAEGENPLVVYGLSKGLPPDTSVAAFGALIDQPADRVAGYAGDADQLIWSEFAEPLTEE